jgi:hypothetical protein
MRKITYFLIFVLTLALMLYLFSDIILTEVSERLITYLSNHVNIPNLSYARPLFKKVRITSYNALTWYGISLSARIVRDEVKNVNEDVSAKIKQLTVTVKDLAQPTFIISMKGITATAVARRWGVTDLSKGPPDSIEGGDISFPIKLRAVKLYELIKQIREISEELKNFSKTGVTKIPIQFSAEEIFEVKGMSFSIRVYVIQEGDEYRLIIDEKSLKKIAASMAGLSLTEGDLRLLSRNPIRAPQLLRIRNSALSTVDALRKDFPYIPVDAYRHVLWSYLLAKAYGKEFAKDCGDAHETEADEEDLMHMGGSEPDAASYQDFNNDAIGREYAVNGYEESSILHRVLTDSDVIRDNEMRAKFDPGKLQEYRQSIAPYLRADQKKMGGSSPQVPVEAPVGDRF